MGERGDTSEVPPYVLKYLERQQVEPEDLPDDVVDLFAGLSAGELALVDLIGTTLQDAGVDASVIVRVH
jgi:hypothetical protein